MSRWKCLGYGIVFGLLFTLGACGKKQDPPAKEPESPKTIEAPAEDTFNEATWAKEFYRLMDEAKYPEARALANRALLQLPNDPTAQAAVKISHISNRKAIWDEERAKNEWTHFGLIQVADLVVPVNSNDPFKNLLVTINQKPSGSFMIGAGVTSDAGQTGSLVLSGGNYGRTQFAVRGFRDSDGSITGTSFVGGGLGGGYALGPPGAVAAIGPLNVPNEQDSPENYERIFDNSYKHVKHDPLSTISSAVDTASYSNIRGRLNAGQMPAKDAVRIADMLNYFNYDYAGPKNDEPVAFSLEIAPCPWQPKHQLLRIGLKAKTIDKDKMPPRNLTFLIDTSGSMSAPNRLPLVKESLKLLVQQLTEKDMVSIVTYAGDAGVALTPTPGSEKDTILRMIDSFNAGGSTNGEGGLKAAYDQCKAGFIKDGINRVILATDGDFNVGLSSDAEMVRLIEEKRDTGVYLTVLGYGMGNLKDSKLEQLAHHGNGHYAYIDTLDEAKKVFVEQGGSLVTVAKDVKLQIEFNPAKVAGYRLIGYENRVLRNEDFRNDKKDAGDMGSGHLCTALYEIVPNGEKVEGEVEPLKYQTVPKLSAASKSGEFATVRMRYKDPLTEKAKEVEAPLAAEALGKKVSNDFEFAACVATFGMLLRDSEFKGNATYQATLETTEGLLREKKDAYREEFAKLVRVAFTVEQAKKK